MNLEELTNEELVEEFASASGNLPGTGASGRSRYYKAQEELLRRLNNVSKR